MGKNSQIEWTHHTFNLVIGCAKVSPACANCYAEALSNRMGWAQWGPNGTRRVMSEAYWRKPLQWNREAAAAGERHRVFCSSLADVFEDHPVVNEQRERLWPLIEQTPNLDWLLLTKRPENFQRFLKVDALGYPPFNVWLGVTVENQEAAEKRIPELLITKASVSFVSCEPLLGPLRLRSIGGRLDALRSQFPHLDWVIAGGESGQGSRPSHPLWFSNLRADCNEARVPFFFKQWGDWWPHRGGCDDPCGKCIMALPDLTFTDTNWEAGPHLKGAMQMHRIGKKRAGRVLDGEIWDQLPFWAAR